LPTVTSALTMNERCNLFYAEAVTVCVVASNLVVYMEFSLFFASFSWWSYILFLLVLVFCGAFLGVSYMGAFCTHDIFYFGILGTSCTASLYLPCLYLVTLFYIFIYRVSVIAQEKVILCVKIYLSYVIIICSMNTNHISN
jgi:hypothetical protein